MTGAPPATLRKSRRFMVRPTLRPFGERNEVNVLRGIAVDSQPFADGYHRVAAGASESLVPTFVGFACLTFAWLLVAVGMSRSRVEP